VDKGLRQESQASATFPFAVSILGLVDKGLRQFVWKYILSHYYSVSILGLVDKGLRQLRVVIKSKTRLSFNPWFSG